MSPRPAIPRAALALAVSLIGCQRTTPTAEPADAAAPTASVAAAPSALPSAAPAAPTAEAVKPPAAPADPEVRLARAIADSVIMLGRHQWYAPHVATAEMQRRTKACEKENNGASCAIVGFGYAKRGLGKFEQKYLTRACALGEPAGCAWIAFAWFLMNADFGSGFDYPDLEIPPPGPGEPRDKALALARRLCDEGHAVGCYMATRVDPPKDWHARFDAWMHGCDLGALPSCTSALQMLTVRPKDEPPQPDHDARMARVEKGYLALCDRASITCGVVAYSYDPPTPTSKPFRDDPKQKRALLEKGCKPADPIYADPEACSALAALDKP